MIEKEDDDDDDDDADDSDDDWEEGGRSVTKVTFHSQLRHLPSKKPHPEHHHQRNKKNCP